jgi:hypothetical protein
MKLRTALVLLVLPGAWLAWQALRPLEAPAPARHGHRATITSSRCPLPPRTGRGAAPLQSTVPEGLALPAVGGAGLRPLAGFSVHARVLAREDYRLDRESKIAPTDLALGWGRMQHDAVLAQLDISQGSRWYRYRWRGTPPIPIDEIVRSSANMHMIPADDAVAAALRRIERGDRVRIDGWLVEATAADGWRWRSSLTREDSGGGACELVYVCAVAPE